MASIVELTPMNIDNGKSADEKISLIIDAVKRNSSDITYILRQLEARIIALEKK